MTKNKKNLDNDTNRFSVFSNFAIGIFFFVSSVSLIYIMWMFVFSWQPVWTAGFNDFHTISSAIDKLDRTASPASETVPYLLEEMDKMNQSMVNMVSIMQNMQSSMNNIEAMSPNVNRMANSVDKMSRVMIGEMPRMRYSLDKINSKLPSTNIIPFW